MSQLGLFAAPASELPPVTVGDLWESPSGREWRVSLIDGEQITMQHTHDGFVRTVTHTEAEWRKQGWCRVDDE